MRSGSSKKAEPVRAEPPVLDTAPTSMADPSAARARAAADGDESMSTGSLLASPTPKRRRSGGNALGY